METLTLIYIIGGSLLGLLLLYLIKQYINGGVCKIVKDLYGTVVFITGGNGGIGEQATYQLAAMGATIVIACRNTTKAQPIIDKIQQDYKKSQSFVVALDLSDLSSVESCVRQFQELRLDKIDILINNAGVMAPTEYIQTKQGYESQFGTNHLGHFYLTEQLMPYLKKSQDPRVVNVSSLAHDMAILDLDDINCTKYAESSLWGTKHTWTAYGNSKLCNLLHAMELYDRHGVVACSLHPGVVRTELFSTFIGNCCKKIVFFFIYPFWYYFTKSPKQGSQTTVYCALADDIQSGGYYKDCKLATPKQGNKQLAQQLWEKSVELLKSQQSYA